MKGGRIKRSNLNCGMQVFGSGSVVQITHIQNGFIKYFHIRDKTVTGSMSIDYAVKYEHYWV